MVYVSRQDYYEIRFASLITNVDKDSLLELYQPLIGATATILYLTMLKQKNNGEGGTIFQLDQLLKTMQVTAGEFLKARQYLEAVGLIRTYEAVEQDIHCYIYVVYSPKSPKAFFDDVLFKGLLIQNVGEKEAKRLANKYKVNLTIPNEYQEVSASFVDVYNLDYDDPSFKKEFGNQIIGRDHGRAKIEFNYDLFFGYVRDHSGIDISIFKKKDMKEIERLATLFGLDEKQMASIIIDGYHPEIPNHFDFYEIKNKCEDQIRYKKVVTTKSHVSGDSIMANKIQMMEEVAPAKFIQYLQQGTKPARSDINIINSLSSNYGFSNGIINVIVEYVLHKNNNILSKNYCEKIAVSLVREGAKNAIDAMNYLNRIVVKSTKKTLQSNVANKKTNEDKDEISLDEMNELLDEMEVNKNGR